MQAYNGDYHSPIYISALVGIQDRAIMLVVKEVARLLNEMLSAHIVADYALFGAVAQMRYTEAVATMDADVLVAVFTASSLDGLGTIYEYCAARGYKPEWRVYPRRGLARAVHPGVQFPHRGSDEGSAARAPGGAPSFYRAVAPLPPPVPGVTAWTVA